MKIILLGVFVSVSSHAALFDSIESVDVLRQQSEIAQKKNAEGAQRSPASDRKPEADAGEAAKSASPSSEIAPEKK